METYLADPMTDAPVYEFPRRFARRKGLSLLALPALFYGALLIGLIMGGPSVRGNSQLVLYLFLFLSAVMGLFMLLVLSSRPWILLFPDRMRVGRREFPVDHLMAVVVFMERRLMFERPPYQLIFVVKDPLHGPTRVTSDAIRNVQDVDTVVRDLRRLLPGVEFVDRTPTGGSAVSEEMLEALDANGKG